MVEIGRVELLGVLRCLAARLARLRQGGKIIVHRLTQFFNQAGDVFVAGAAFKRFAQGRAGRLKALARQFQRFVLQLQGERPEFFHRVVETFAVLTHHAPERRAQQKIVRRVVEEDFRRQRDGVERTPDAAPVLRRRCKRLALFDHGSGERVEKRPCREGNRLLVGCAGLAGPVFNHDPGERLQSRPGIGLQIKRIGALAGGSARAVQRDGSNL